LATPEGKKQKDEHLDWHFRANTRADENTSIIHRSAYLNEVQWTQLEEEGSSSTQRDKPSTKKPEEQWVPQPDDINLQQKPCSICMERFKPIWDNNTDQGIWMDAVRVGDEYFHATCYELVSRPKGHGKSKARGTPDTILGKRKFK
jgi:pre-mRNA cleavage complex 2 protein Pcf11